MSLTPRERAADLYHLARQLDARRPLAPDPRPVLRERLALIERAQAAISAARGTPRHFFAEPTDDQLEKMWTSLFPLWTRIANYLYLIEAKCLAEEKEMKA